MRCLVGWRVVTVGAVLSCALGCWSSSSSTRAYGTGGAEWSAAGRSGGQAGTGGAAGEGGGIECGSIRCAAGMTCCNPACGICAPPGGGCVAGCPATGGSDGGGIVGGASAGTGGAVSSVPDGGVPVDAAVTCDDLHNQYAANLLAAQRCTVDAGDQCTQLVYKSFPFDRCGFGCGMIYVNDGSALTPLLQEVLAAHCVLEIGCDLACQTPASGVCIATDGGTGICGSVYAEPFGRRVVQHSMQ